MLHITLNNMIHTNLTGNSALDAMQIINQKVLNLLSSARLYIDQISHELSSLEKELPGLKEEVLTRFSKEYDDKLSYRSMEALRNYTQHRSFPVTNISFNSKLIQETDPHTFCFQIEAKLKLSEIENDPKFKRSVYKELREKMDSINIIPMLRDYIECIGIIHEELRTTLNSHMGLWIKTIYEAIETGRANGKIHNLHIIRLKDDKPVDKQAIFEDIIIRIKDLIKKNRSFKNMSKRYVSGKY